MSSAALPAHADPSIANPTFSDPKIDSTAIFGRCNNELPGWSVETGRCVELYGTTHANHDDGYQAIDLNGGRDGAITTTVSGTKKNKKYKVTWDHATNGYDPCIRNNDLNRLNQKYDVEVNNNSNSSKSYNAGQMAKHPVPEWGEQEYTFTARGANTPLKFNSTTTTGVCGPMITNLAIEEMGSNSGDA